MYLGFLQNRPGATIAGLYSLRPKPGATVSTGGLFKGVPGEGVDLEKTLKKAKTIFE